MSPGPRIYSDVNWRHWFYEGVPFYSPPQIDTWEEVKSVLNPGFVQYVEENILTR